MTLVPIYELPQFVRNVTATLAVNRNNTKAVVLALEGDLGSGKTTFVQQLAKQMGVQEVVQSPTYVLMKKYQLPEGLNPMGQQRRFKTLVHIDAYRLEEPAQFKALRPEEFLNEPSNLVVIEWPEKVEGFLPKPDMVVNFSADEVGDMERIIDMEQ